MNNLNTVQNVFISDGTALPANNAAVSSVTDGKIGIYGSDWTALNPAGGDTITTQPSIYVVEAKTESDGALVLKKSMKIDGTSVIRYHGESYAAAKREVWSIGHSRLTNTGTIEVNNDTNYNFSIRFKNDKFLYSERPELFNVNFTSATSATQLSIATQIASAINNGPFRSQVTAIVVGDGTGVYGVTGATDYGVEITAKDVNQFSSTTYTPNLVYFSVHVNDASGFESTTTCTQIQAFDPGVGTYAQVYTMENKAFGAEGVLNRRQWPIPVLDYSASSSYVNSAVIGINTTGTAGEDQVTFASTIAAILKPGDKVEIDGVNYEIKYIKGNGTGTTGGNEVVLTSVLLTSPGTADVTKLRVQYDLVTIEFNDSINTPTGIVATANKSVVIASPALDAGDAYNGVSAASQDLMDILNAWMTTTPGAFANIAI
jgi:hypothetical protein